MRFISWNVNGFRAVLGKGFVDIFDSLNADVFAIQETKMQDGQADFCPDGYNKYFFFADKKGYSGTAIFSKLTPVSVTYGIRGKHNDEGRVITLEYDTFYFVNAYVPNAQDGLKRIQYRMEFEDDMRDYLNALSSTKGVVYCGDLNVAFEEIDIKNAKSNIGNPGFSYEERGKFGELISSGFVDSFRWLHPDTVKYSWWSYRFKARENNAGWRIDYFLVSENIKDRIKAADILTEIMGSDHCPVCLEIEL